MNESLQSFEVPSRLDTKNITECGKNKSLKFCNRKYLRGTYGSIKNIRGETDVCTSHLPVFLNIGTAGVSSSGSRLYY